MENNTIHHCARCGEVSPFRLCNSCLVIRGFILLLAGIFTVAAGYLVHNLGYTPLAAVLGVLYLCTMGVFIECW